MDPIAPATGQGTPAPAVAPAQPPAQPVTPAPAAAATEPAEPTWLPARLTRAEEAARTKLLTELGIDDPAKAKAFIDAGRAAENEKKTLAEKLAEQATALTTTKAQADKYSSIIALQATAQMGSLTVEQQAAVKAIAGDDPAEQLRTVIALAPTWAASAAKAAPVTTPAAPVAPPASTTPAPSAPAASGSTTSPPDHKAVHQQLLTTNPFAAAEYAARNPSVFE